MVELTTSATVFEMTRHGLDIPIPYTIHQNCPNTKMQYMMRLISAEDFRDQIRYAWGIPATAMAVPTIVMKSSEGGNMRGCYQG